MTFSAIVALIVAMSILALIPGPAVFAVSAQAMARGFKPAAIMTLGIVAGDYVFVCLSLAGLLAVAQLLGDFFTVIKYLGALYLFWLAWSLWRTAKQGTPSSIPGTGASSGFFTGLFITLGNPKAILFYVGFFPAFLDLTQLTFWDIGIILLVTAVTVGGITLAYAFLASKLGQSFLNSPLRQRFNQGAALVLASTGAVILWRE